MRILLVADIHANWPALRTLQENYDICLCLGDLVDYALDPVPCIDWARRHAHYSVRGNHDHAVAQNIIASGRNGFKYLTSVTRQVTRSLLGEPDLRFLANLPVTQAATLDGTRFLLVHATPRDPLDEYAYPDAELWGRRLQNVEADVICVGHTHQPYVLEVGDKLVINPGSLGQPRDGDPRGAYAIIDDNRVELKRLHYPVEETVAKINESPIPDQAKELLAEAFRTGKPILRTNSNGDTPRNVNGPDQGLRPRDQGS